MKKLVFLCCFFLLANYLQSQQTISLVGVLPEAVNETSGIIFYNGRLITHNDSGNSPELFEIDTLTQQITRIVEVSNAENIDWEDLAQDQNYIYIGDIGNNRGDRTDLAVYRISKMEYDNSNTVSAERIGFSYEDQTDFNPTSNSDWDAEALTMLRGQLTLFTKRWQTGGSSVYVIPSTPGEHMAINLGSTQFSGLVTAATYNDITNVLYLLGYSQLLQPFLVRYEDPPGPLSFSGNGEFSNLNIGLAQTEAIAFVDANIYYISSERFINSSPPIALEASLFKLETEDDIMEPGPIVEDPPPVIPPEDDPDPLPEENNEELVLFREFGSSLLHYELNTEDDLFGRAIFDTSGRRVQYTAEREIDGNSIDISNLERAVYYIAFYMRRKIISKAFISD